MLFPDYQQFAALARKATLVPVAKTVAADLLTPVSALPPFTGGAVGFFSHDAVRQLEKLPNLAQDDLKIPDCALMFFDRLLAFDHVRHEIYIIATADVRHTSPRKAYELAL